MAVDLEYTFVPARNLAYRYFATRFFAEGGVEFVDEYMNVERAEAIVRNILSKDPKTLAETLFCECFRDIRSNLRSNAQALLESRWLLEKIYGKLDAQRTKEIERMLPAKSGLKLIFNKHEIAKQLFDFYTIDLREALRNDLEDGSQRVLFRHIQLGDEDRLPDARHVGPTRYDEAVRTFVEKIFLWVNQITPEGVCEDIEKALADHERTPFSTHMWRFSTGPGRYYISCKHEFKYVVLDGHPNEDGTIGLSLTATRKPVYDELDMGPYIICPNYVVEPAHQ